MLEFKRGRDKKKRKRRSVGTRIGNALGAGAAKSYSAIAGVRDGLRNASKSKIGKRVLSVGNKALDKSAEVAGDIRDSFVPGMNREINRQLKSSRKKKK